MAVDSKIRFFFTLALVFTIVSCEKNKNDVIPDRDVNFRMDIGGDPLFTGLAAIGNSVVVTSKTNNYGIYATGFDDNGIIIYRAQLDMSPEFYAYDRTCPHDYVTDGQSIKVDIDFIQAICPRCSTHYELSIGGLASSGPGKYPLKNYKTRFDGRFLDVWNY